MSSSQEDKRCSDTSLANQKRLKIICDRAVELKDKGTQTDPEQPKTLGEVLQVAFDGLPAAYRHKSLADVLRDATNDALSEPNAPPPTPVRAMTTKDLALDFENATAAIEKEAASRDRHHTSTPIKIETDDEAENDDDEVRAIDSTCPEWEMPECGQCQYRCSGLHLVYDEAYNRENNNTRSGENSE